MYLEIEDKVKDFLAIITKENFNAKIEIIDSIIRKYAQNGGDRKKLISFLMSEYENLDDKYLEEFIGELLSRVSDHCSPIYRYNWSSLDV